MIVIGQSAGSLWAILKDIISGIHRLHSRPKLEVCFIPSETFHIAADLAFGGVRGLFLHVIVKNVGRGRAEQCKGILTEVLSRKEAGQLEPVRDFRNPVELHWAHEPLDCYAKDIEATEHARLDVCFVHELFNDLHFFCDKRPRGIQTDFPPGKYVIEITVRSENGAQDNAAFEIDWGGSFDSLSMRTHSLS